MTWDLQTSKNLNSDVKIRYPTFKWFPWCLKVFLMIQWSSDKVKVTVNKFGIHFRHVIRCFLFHYNVFCLANVNINYLPAYIYGIWKSVFPKKACFDVSRFILSRIFTRDPNPTALSDVYRLFTTIVYLAIQITCFDAIFDCITNMIGRLFNLHIVKSTPNNQTRKRRDFLIFILTLTSHLKLSYVFILKRKI